MENLKTKSIGSFVADNYKAAAVFKKYGIDFCCKGNITIEEVCESKNVPLDELLSKLEDVTKQKDNQNIDFKSWPLDLLADYIEKTHHRYINETTPVLVQYLDKLCKVHGSGHPELLEINYEFNESVRDLGVHKQKEEVILFPFIRQMVSSKDKNDIFEDSCFGTIESPIAVMMQEHDNEGERFRKIAILSNNYNPPSDACNTYRVAFSLLKEFEEDLHMHIHLENNILFPKSIELEKELS